MVTMENNKLIAEFMGVLTVNMHGDIKEDISQFKYHSDWNWLIPVIQEIGNRTGYELCMRLENSYWNNSGNEETNSEYGGYENIISIHYAVVSFIKWHNDNQTKWKQEYF